MKLAEAKIKLSQIEDQLELNLKLMRHGPIKSIVSLLEESNTMLSTQEALKKKIAETEATALLEGNVLSDVICAFDILDQKVAFLEELALRLDIDTRTKQSVCDQLHSFRSTRDSLRLSIEACLWETELLE